MLGELDLIFSQKKKAVKFDIILTDERNKLEKANNQIDIAVDDDDVDNIAKHLEEGYGEGRRNTGSAMGGGGTNRNQNNDGNNVVFGRSQADTKFVERFIKEKELEKEIKSKNPARYYQTMNFELTHMKLLQEQKDRILTLDAKKQGLDPFGKRCSAYMAEGFKSSVCDL